MKMNGQHIYDNIVEIRSRLADIEEQLEEYELELAGMEIDHPNYPYCVIEFISGDEVHMFAEDEEGNPIDFMITFAELRDLLY